MFAQATSAVKKDLELDQPPEDSISKLAFAPNSNYLVASSWDNNVSRKGTVLFNAHLLMFSGVCVCTFVQIRCYEVQPTSSSCKAQQSHAGPILDCCWHQVSTVI